MPALSHPTPTAADVEALFHCRATGGRGAAALHPLLRTLVGVSDDAVAAAYEGAVDDRRAGGVFYTPPEFAAELVTRVLDRRSGDPVVLDPACGGGNLLVAVAEQLVAGGATWDEVLPRLHGIDIDPVAVAIARGRLLERAGRVRDGWADAAARLVVGDALRLDECPGGPPDLVIGNPPFGNAIEAATRRTAAERATYASRFPEAATGAYDKAGLFVERALRWARPGGRVALVLPRALLSAPYADRLRRWVDRSHRLSALVATAAHDHFADAAVYVVGAVFEVGAGGPERRVERVDLGGASTLLPPPPDSRWSVLLSPHAAVVRDIDGTWPRLDEVAAIQAGASAGEAYEVLPHVTDARPASGWRLVTTGLVDPFKCHWGTRKCRYLKRDFATPWLPRDAVSPRRAALYDRPKVIVAGLSRVLEAVVDPTGDIAGAVATLLVTVDNDDGAYLARICAFLNSDAARHQFLALHGAQALGGGSVQVTKKKLGELRVPPEVLSGD